MGGDHAPEAAVLGAIEAARAFGIEVSLIGSPGTRDHAELRRFNPRAQGISIVPARDQIDMSESPTEAVRRKRDYQSSSESGL